MLRPEWTQHSSSTGLPKAIEIGEARQLGPWLERFRAAGVTPSLCESLLDDELVQYSVGAARDSLGRIRTFVAEKVRPRAEQCAGGTFVAPAHHEGAEALAAIALDKLGFVGVGEVEVLHAPKTGKSYLIEVNARPWLQFALPHACGCDLLGHAMERATNTRGRNESHAWLYFSSDLYVCFSRSTGLFGQRKLALPHYLMSLLAADVYALWDWRDPAPWIASAARSGKSAFRRLLGRLNLGVD